MNEQILNLKEYESWDEAFRGLVPAIRQQSVRVATYTQVLFVQACASSYGKFNSEWNDRIKEEYADLAYKCGLYHQLGKATLAPEYQLWRKEFKDEEKALYQTYPEKGRFLVAMLQEMGVKSKKISEGVERPTQNIPWLMVRETCEQHMERWDGSGYPNGSVGNEISPIAQIVGLAKELDRLVSDTKSENPFNEAYVELIQQAGVGFSEELIEVLKASRGKCRAVYKKYIQYSKTLPKTVPLVDKRKERPMGLTYKYVATDDTTNGVIYEAVPWFGGVYNEPEKKENMQKLEPMMIRTKMLPDIMFYLLYEVSDTILRMKNCQLNLKAMVMPMPAGFYVGDTMKERFIQLFIDQPIDVSKLLLLVPEQVVMGADKKAEEILVDYIESGFQLVVDDYHPEYLPIERVQEIGFTKVRLAEDAEKESRILWNRGIEIISRSVTKETLTEEEVIQKLLISER